MLELKRLGWCLAGVGLAALGGCRSRDPGEAPKVAPAAPAGIEGRAAAPPPFTAAELSPRLQALGPPGAIPTRITAYFPVAVAEARWVQRGAGSSRLTVEPAVEGKLVFDSPDTLTFTPAAPLAAGAHYRFSLEQVETSRGRVTAPASGWRLELDTPLVSLVGMDVDRVSASTGELAVVLRFSAPLESAEGLRRAAQLRLDGVLLRASGVEPLGDGSSARLSFRTPSVSVKDRAALALSVEVAAGLRFKGGDRLPETARAAASIAGGALSGGELAIKAVALRETGEGFAVRVVCDDDNEQDARYYWDRELSQHFEHLSERCAVSLEEARRSIRITPAVPFSVAEGSHGFELVGPFKQGVYDVTLLPGLRSATGATSRVRTDKTVQVPARKPLLSFVSSGRYLPRTAWNNLGVRHLNVSEVQVTVRQVPPENLVFWMSNEQSEDADERTANTLLSKSFRLKGESDRAITSWLDLGSFVPQETQGLLQIQLTGAGAKASARVLLTPLQLVAKRSAPAGAGRHEREVWVWALEMGTGEPQAGVEIQLVKKSGQVLGRCVTQGVAGCKLKDAADPLDGSAPFALVARKGRDLTYLKYSELQTDLAEADVAGEAESASPYRAALYSDRGVYRPGETAHLSAILREQRHLAPPANMPFELRVLNPRQQVAKKWTLMTNEAGLVTQDLALPDFADTGRYTVRAFVADAQVGELSLNVEEFVPERMKVALSPLRPELVSGAEAAFKVDARYLFGGVPAGSDLELKCSLSPATYKIESRGNYTFGLWSPTTPRAQDLELAKATLGADGAATAKCGGAPDVARTMRLEAQVSVFEAGSGRATVNSASAWVHPEKFYLGLKTGSAAAEADHELRFDGVVVDWKGQAFKEPEAEAPRSVTVEWLRVEQEYGWWWDDREGSESYKPHLKQVVESSVAVPVKDGQLSFTVTPTRDAYGYVLKVRAGRASTSLFLPGRGDWYWGGEGESEAPRTPRPTRATPLVFNVAKRAKVGETLGVKTQAPFPGWLLLTSEADGVLTAEWKKVPAGPVELSVPVKRFSPTLYVSGLLVKDPHAESAQGFLPDRAFGVVPVAIEPTDYQQTLTLQVPAEVRSGASLEVGLQATPGSFATVAVVDEGVLSVTRFPSPDPLSALFAKRALGVQTYETVGWSLLMPPQGPTRTTGGDVATGQGGRVQPVKPVALWSGVVRLDAAGKATARFTLPPYRGALRVMAVAASGQRVGSAARTITVADPLVVQATLPRFVSQNDEVLIPVFLTNLSGKPLTARLRLTSENLPVPGLSSPLGSPPALKLLGKPEGEVRLGQGESKTLVFRALAMAAIGAAKVRVVAESGALRSEQSADVPFQPAQARERVSQAFALDAASIDLKPKLSGWVPSTERTTVWVSTNPYAASFEKLKYLLHYPYGCVEQTTSSMRPLLFSQALIGDVDPEWAAQHNVDDMVRAGIERLFTMQTPSGGIGYWPGAAEPHLWGTAYAAHALHEAGQLGHPVPRKRLDDALDWLAQQAQLQGNHGQVNEHGDSWNVSAYVHYVLALTGRGNKAEIARALAAQPGAPRGPELEATYLLKAALYLAGDRRFEADLKAPQVELLTSDRRDLEHSFYSDERALGMVLNVMQDLKLQDAPAAETLASRVAADLADDGRSRYYNTQEVVWGVTGLGKRLLAAAAALPPPTLLLDGKRLDPTATAKAAPNSRSFAVYRASELASLELKLSERPKGKVYVLVQSEGVRTHPTVAYGHHGVELSRTFHRASGEVFDPRTTPLALSELAYVELTVSNPTDRRLANLALVDGLPAGWEIENPRLRSGGIPSWVDAESLWQVDALNVRDNRLELFGAVKPGKTVTFVYAVRAVTGGRFTQPPVELEAMYDSSVWARGPGGAVWVTPPWKDEVL